MKGLTHREQDISVQFMDKRIRPQKTIRLLGVVLDEQLKMKEHVLQASVRATKKCMALARLEGIRPKQMRQLYKSVVVPTMDYGAAAWYAPDRHGYFHLNKHLDRVQRLGAKAITGAFRTVSLEVLQDEACLDSTTVRLSKRVIKHMIDAASRDSENPLNKCIQKWGRNKRKCSTALQNVGRQHYKTLQDLLHPKQSTKPRYIAPWLLSTNSKITDISSDRDQANQRCKDIADKKDRSKVFYTDGSAANKRCGSAVVQIDTSNQVTVVKAETIGTEKTCAILSAEITAIRLAVEYICKTGKKRMPYWILSDSQDAIRVIDKGQGTSTSRAAATRLLAAIRQAQQRTFELHVMWCPSHGQIEGNIAADRAAKATTLSKARVTDNKEIKTTEGTIVCQHIKRKVEEEGANKPRTQGKYTYDMDRALPGKHTIRIYSTLSHKEASILMQARTGHTHLNSYLKRIRTTDTARCEYGAEKETVKHVLLVCPLWQTLRQKLKDEAKERWNDLSFLLGGWSGQRNKKGELIDGPKEKWKPNLAVVKATINFLKETNRMISTPQQENNSQVNSSQGTGRVPCQTRITSYFTLI